MIGQILSTKYKFAPRNYQNRFHYHGKLFLSHSLVNTHPQRAIPYMSVSFAKIHPSLSEQIKTNVNQNEEPVVTLSELLFEPLVPQTEQKLWSSHKILEPSMTSIGKRCSRRTPGDLVSGVLILSICCFLWSFTFISSSFLNLKCHGVSPNLKWQWPNNI